MIENVLGRLDGVKQTGTGKWIAKCPSHPDKTPSLSLAEADGKVLIHCFSGCAAGDVVAAIGLELSDLFPPRESTGRPVKRPDYRGMWMLARRSYYVLLLAMSDILDGKKLSPEDWETVSKATAKISEVIEVLDV
jgi:hypothetical protein